MIQNLRDLKDLFEKLIAVDDRVRDEDMVFYALNGLPSEHIAFKSIVRLQGYPIDFSELASLLEIGQLNLAIDKKIHSTI